MLDLDLSPKDLSFKVPEAQLRHLIKLMHNAPLPSFTKIGAIYKMGGYCAPASQVKYESTVMIEDTQQDPSDTTTVWFSFQSV